MPHYWHPPPSPWLLLTCSATLPLFRSGLDFWFFIFLRRFLKARLCSALPAAHQLCVRLDGHARRFRAAACCSLAMMWSVPSQGWGMRAQLVGNLRAAQEGAHKCTLGWELLRDCIFISVKKRHSFARHLIWWERYSKETTGMSHRRDRSRKGGLWDTKS